MWYLISQEGAESPGSIKEKLKRGRVPFQEVSLTRPYRIEGFAIPQSNLEQALGIIGMSPENTRKALSKIREISTGTNIDGLLLLDLSEFSMGPRVVRGEGNIEAWDAVKTVLTEYAASLNLRIFVSNPHGNTSSPETKPNTLFVKFYSIPSGRTRSKGYSRAFGLALEGGQKDGLYPSGTGFVVSDDQGVDVAEVVDGNIYILFDLPHASGGIVMSLLKSVMGRAVDFMRSPEKKQRYQDQEKNRQREMYIQHCSQRFEKEIGEARAQLDRCRHEIASQEAALVVATRQREEIDRRIAILSEEEARLKETFLQGFENIKSVDGVEAVRVAGEVLQIFTDEILIENNGSKRRIGKFRVDIHTRGTNGGVKCWNLSGKAVDAETKREFQHPHVEADGTCGLGGNRIEVLKLIGANQYPTVAQIMMNFLRNYSETDKFSSLENFPLA